MKVDVCECHKTLVHMFYVYVHIGCLLLQMPYAMVYCRESYSQKIIFTDILNQLAGTNHMHMFGCCIFLSSCAPPSYMDVCLGPTTIYGCMALVWLIK